MSAPPMPGAAPATARRPSRAAGTVVTGALLVLGGLVWLAQELDLLEVRWRVGLALAVLAVGVLLVASARGGRLGGLVPLGVVLSVLLVLSIGVPRAPLAAGAGDREFRPTSVDQLEPAYELGAGTLVLDLRSLPTAATGDEPLDVTTEVSVGLGEVQVLVPRDASVSVTASAGAGELDVLGRTRDGLSPGMRTSGGTGADRVTLDLQVGLGSVQVTR